MKFLLLKKKLNIISIISVIKHKKYKILKKKILFYLLIRPHKLLINFFFICATFDRSSNNIKLGKNKNYLHLLHLVIFKDYFRNISLKKKDAIFNFFFTKIVKKYDARYFYLCYEKDTCSFYTITGIEDKSSEENLKMVQELIRLKKEFDEQKE